MYKQIASNKRNTWFIVILFTLFFAGLGYGLGWFYTGDEREAIGFLGYFGIGALIYAFITYMSAGKITLAIAGAKEIQKKDQPQLYRIVENLCIASGVPTPKIYLIEDTALNAFATGRNPEHAAVAVTRGLLEKLDKAELEGVMAHELSHIQNYDIRLQSFLVALVGLVALASDIFLRSLTYGRGGRSSSRRNGQAQLVFILVGIVLAILAPIVAQIMKLAVSRQREYLADASGALLTRYPEGLARALEKIRADKEPLEVANKATAHLYIEDPLRNEEKMKWLNSLFHTHPPVEERIKRLRGMGV